MKKITSFSIFLLLLWGYIYSTRVVYFAKVTDISGDINIVSNCCTYQGRYCWSEFEVKKGESAITIPFSKIKIVEVLSQNPVPGTGGYPSLITLINGLKIKVLMKSYSFSGKTEFGSRYQIEFKKTKQIEFLHDGRYKKCSLCDTLFYNSELEFCPYCKGKLEQKN